MANFYDVNAAIQKPNVLGAMQQGLQFGQQQRALREQRADQQRLRELAPQIQQGDPGAFRQAAAIDPQAAGAQLSAGDLVTRRMEPLVRLLEEADARDPREAQALWQSQGVPFVRQFSQGTEPVADWQQAKPMLAQLKARIEMAKSAQGTGNVQSTQILANGNIGIITRDRRVIDTGQKAAPTTQLINEPGQTPYLVTTGRGAVGQTTGIGPSGSVQPMGGVGGPTGGRMDHQSVIDMANRMTQMGADPAQVDAWMESELSKPQHVSPAGGQAPPSGPLPQRNPTAAEVEGDKTRAREAAEMETLRARGQIEAQNAADAAAAKQAIETAADRSKTAAAKAPQLQNVERGLDRIEQALTALEAGAVGDTGPLDQYYQRLTKEGQELEGAVGAIQNDMLSLTRVPGVGSQSELEAKIAGLKYPSLGNHPDVNRRNVQQLRAFMRDLAESIGRAPAPAGQQAQAPRGPRPGDIEDGYRFRGGDPSNPNSWEQVR